MTRNSVEYLQFELNILVGYNSLLSLTLIKLDITRGKIGTTWIIHQKIESWKSCLKKGDL